MKQLYKLLLSELANASIKYIDFDSGQLERADQALLYPAALIKINAVNSDIDEAASQRKSWTVQFRVAFEALGAKTNSLASSTAIERSLAFADICQELYDLFQGVELLDYDAFECVDEGLESRTDTLFVYKYTFKTAVNVFK